MIWVFLTIQRELDLIGELEVEEPPTELLAWLLVDVFPDLVSELEEKCY